MTTRCSLVLVVGIIHYGGRRHGVSATGGSANGNGTIRRARGRRTSGGPLTLLLSGVFVNTATVTAVGGNRIVAAEDGSTGTAEDEGGHGFSS